MSLGVVGSVAAGAGETWAWELHRISHAKADGMAHLISDGKIFSTDH